MAIGSINSQAAQQLLISRASNEAEKLQHKIETHQRYADGAEAHKAGAIQNISKISEKFDLLNTELSSMKTISSTMQTSVDVMSKLHAKIGQFTTDAPNSNDAALTNAANNLLRDVTNLMNTADARGGYLFGSNGKPVKQDLTEAANSNIDANGNIVRSLFDGGAASIEFNGKTYQFADVKSAIDKVITAANYAKGYNIPAAGGGVPRVATLEERKAKCAELAEAGMKELNDVCIRNSGNTRTEIQELIFKSEDEIKIVQAEYVNLTEFSEAEMEGLYLNLRQLHDRTSIAFDLWLYNLNMMQKFSASLSSNS